MFAVRPYLHITNSEILSHAGVDPLQQSRSPAETQQLLATQHDWPTIQLVWPSVVISTHLSAVFPIKLGNVVLVAQGTDG